jgi:hypothetical protein
MTHLKALAVGLVLLAVVAYAMTALIAEQPPLRVFYSFAAVVYWTGGLALLPALLVSYYGGLAFLGLLGEKTSATRHAQAVFLGFFVCCGVGMVLVGPQTLGLALAIAVICTFGAGLIPILLVSYAVGRAVMGLFSGGQASEDGKAAPNEMDRVRGLARYLRRGRERGISSEHLRSTVLDAGWRSEEVAEAEKLCARWEAREGY